MRIFIGKAALLAAAFVSGTTQVLAHAGHHTESSWSSVFQHMFSSPYHLGVIGIVVIIAVVLMGKIVSSQNDSND